MFLQQRATEKFTQRNAEVKIAENMQRTITPKGCNICSTGRQPCEKRASAHSVAGRKAVRSRMQQRRKADHPIVADSNNAFAKKNKNLYEKNLYSHKNSCRRKTV